MGESIVESVAHRDDALCHFLHFTLPSIDSVSRADVGGISNGPLRIELRRAEDGARDVGAMHRRVGVHGANDDLELAVNASLLLGRGCDERERANTLAVQAHVLSGVHTYVSRTSRRPYTTR